VNRKNDYVSWQDRLKQSLKDRGLAKNEKKLYRIHNPNKKRTHNPWSQYDKIWLNQEEYMWEILQGSKFDPFSVLGAKLMKKSQ